MKNGKLCVTNEIAKELLEKIGGGGPNDPAPSNQGQISLNGSVNPNGYYNYNVGVSVLVNPNSIPSVTIGAGVGGNSDRPVEAVHTQISMTW